MAIDYIELARKVRIHVKEVDDMAECNCPTDPETGVYTGEQNPHCWYNKPFEEQERLQLESLARRLEVVLGEVQVQN